MADHQVSLAIIDLPDHDFADVVIVAIPESSWPIPDDARWWASQVFSVSNAPLWVKTLLAVRQRLVKVVGIERAGSGVFDIDRADGNEALISEDATHLDFRAAVGIDAGNRLLSVTTTVRFNNKRGRLYWIPVSILHDPVTRSMARRAVARFTETGSL